MNRKYPQSGIAQLLADKGRNGDSMLVHMTPDEVQKLQQIAAQNGTSMTINPHTGLPEASWLSDTIDSISDSGLGAVVGGATLGFLGFDDVTAGVIVGASQLISQHGDVGNAIVQGMSGYGGAQLEGMAENAISNMGQKIDAFKQGWSGTPSATPKVDELQEVVPTAEVRQIRDIGDIAGATAGGDTGKAADQLQEVIPTAQYANFKNIGATSPYDFAAPTTIEAKTAAAKKDYIPEVVKKFQSGLASMRAVGAPGAGTGAGTSGATTPGAEQFKNAWTLSMLAPSAHIASEQAKKDAEDEAAIKAAMPKPSKYVGTNIQSVQVRNPNYGQPGQPLYIQKYVDTTAPVAGAKAGGLGSLIKKKSKHFADGGITSGTTANQYQTWAQDPDLIAGNNALAAAGKATNYSGDYGHQSYGDAFNSFKKAAEAGNAQAQANLGAAYASGFGGNRDDIEAAKWSLIAAKNGYGNVGENSNYYWMTQRMSPEQIAEAQRRADAYGKPVEPTQPALINDAAPIKNTVEDVENWRKSLDIDQREEYKAPENAPVGFDKVAAENGVNMGATNLPPPVDPFAEPVTKENPQGQSKDWQYYNQLLKDSQRPKATADTSELDDYFGYLKGKDTGYGKPKPKNPWDLTVTDTDPKIDPKTNTWVPSGTGAIVSDKTIDDARTDLQKRADTQALEIMSNGSFINNIMNRDAEGHPTHDTAWGTRESEPMWGVDKFEPVNPRGGTFKNVDEMMDFAKSIKDNISSKIHTLTDPALKTVDDVKNFMVSHYDKTKEWFDDNLFEGAGDIANDLFRLFVPYGGLISGTLGENSLPVDVNDPGWKKFLEGANNKLRNMPLLGAPFSLMEDILRSAYHAVDNYFDPNSKYNQHLAIEADQATYKDGKPEDYDPVAAAQERLAGDENAGPTESWKWNGKELYNYQNYWDTRLAEASDDEEYQSILNEKAQYDANEDLKQKLEPFEGMTVNKDQAYWDNQLANAKTDEEYQDILNQKNADAAQKEKATLDKFGITQEDLNSLQLGSKFDQPLTEKEISVLAQYKDMGDINAGRNAIIDKWEASRGLATSDAGVGLTGGPGTFADDLNIRGQHTTDLNGDIGYVPHNPGDPDSAGQLAGGVPVTPFDRLRDYYYNVEDPYNTGNAKLDLQNNYNYSPGDNYNYGPATENYNYGGSNFQGGVDTNNYDEMINGGTSSWWENITPADQTNYNANAIDFNPDELVFSGTDPNATNYNNNNYNNSSTIDDSYLDNLSNTVEQLNNYYNVGGNNYSPSYPSPTNYYNPSFNYSYNYSYSYSYSYNYNYNYNYNYSSSNTNDYNPYYAANYSYYSWYYYYGYAEGGIISGEERERKKRKAEIKKRKYAEGGGIAAQYYAQGGNVLSEDKIPGPEGRLTRAQVLKFANRGVVPGPGAVDSDLYGGLEEGLYASKVGGKGVTDRLPKIKAAKSGTKAEPKSAAQIEYLVKRMSEQGYAGGGMAGFAQGGTPPGYYKAGGRLLNGDGDGMSDSIPAMITGKEPQRAALADGEFVVPADVVSHLGNGSTKAGAKKLYHMMDQIRKARTGRKKQAPQVNADKFLPR